MKEIVKDFLIGILVVIIVTVFEFLVTLPLGGTLDFSSNEYYKFINIEFLLTSLPAAFTTFAFAWLLKTKRKPDAYRRGIIWTVVICLNYIIIGLENDNFVMIFKTIGIYVLLLCSYLGPVLYAKAAHLK